MLFAFGDTCVAAGRAEKDVMPARAVKSCCCPASGDSECSLVTSNATSEMSGLGFHTLDCGYERPGSGFHISDS